MHSEAGQTDWVYVWLILMEQHQIFPLSRQYLRHVPLWSLYLLRHQRLSLNKPWSTSAIYLESLVAYCYKPRWRLCFCLWKNIKHSLSDVKVLWWFIWQHTCWENAAMYQQTYKEHMLNYVGMLRVRIFTAYSLAALLIILTYFERLILGQDQDRQI